MFQELYEYAKTYPLPTFIFLMFLFFLLGDSIVIYLMETQIKKMPRWIFILTFMFSLALLVLMLFEILQIGTQFERIQLWRLALNILTFDCLIIPIIIMFKLIYRTEKDKQKNWIPKTKISLIVFIGCIYFYFKLLIQQSEKTILTKSITIEHYFDFFGDIHIRILIEFILHYGTWIMAIMSGYGAVWCPYTYKNSLYTQKQKLQKARQQMTGNINFIMKSIVKMKYQILFIEEKKAALEKKMIENKPAAKGLVGALIGYLPFPKVDANKIQLNEYITKLDSLKLELETLEKAHKDNFEIYKQIVDQERRHQISLTFLGKLFRFFSLILSIYSVFRLFFTILNIIKGRNRQSNDPITRLLSFIFWFVSHEENQLYYNTACSYISFGFMGYLIFSNVRSFSINMKNLFDLIFRRGIIKKLEMDIIVLIISEMYGVYFLTAVILMQLSLPKIYMTNLKSVIGNIDVVDYFTYFDHIFLVCSVMFLIFIFFLEKNRNDRMRKYEYLKQK